MTESHRIIQEELALWALGIAPDLPISTLVEHLVDCPECRRFLQSAHETAGELALLVSPRYPPASLKQRIMESVSTASSPAAEAAEAGGEGIAVRTMPKEGDGETTPASFGGEGMTTDGAADGPARGGKERERRGAAPRAAGWLRTASALTLVAAVLLGARAVELSERVSLLQREVDVWTARYESDFRWLRSAEKLLVHEVGPKLTASLAPAGVESSPQEAEEPAGEDRIWPRGKAAVYDAYEGRLYLLVSVEGLKPAASYDVWIGPEGAAKWVGTLTTSGQGDAVFAYPGESGEMMATVEVRRGEEPVLAGTLAPGASEGNAW